MHYKPTPEQKGGETLTAEESDDQHENDDNEDTHKRYLFFCTAYSGRWLPYTHNHLTRNLRVLQSSADAPLLTLSSPPPDKVPEGPTTPGEEEFNHLSASVLFFRVPRLQ